MPESKPLTLVEMELIIRKLQPVKDAGFGEVLIKIQNGSIVYITQSIGEQFKMDLKLEN